MHTTPQAKPLVDHSYKKLDEKLLFLSEQLDLCIFDDDDISKNSFFSTVTNKIKNRNIVSDWNKIMPFSFKLGISTIPPAPNADLLNIFDEVIMFSTTDENNEILSSNEDPHIAVGLACIVILERKIAQEERIKGWLAFGKYLSK